MLRQCQPIKDVMQSVAGFGQCKLRILCFNPTVYNNKRSGRTIFKNRGKVLSPLEELVALFFLRARSQVRWWLYRYWAPRAPFPSLHGINLWNGSRALLCKWDCGGEILQFSCIAVTETLPEHLGQSCVREMLTPSLNMQPNRLT